MMKGLTCVTVILWVMLIGANGLASQDRDLGALLDQGPPPLKACLQQDLSRDQLDHLWHLLKKVNRQHEQIFRILALLMPPQQVPATAYGSVFPYRHACSEIEKMLFFCIDQFVKDKLALERSVFKQVSQDMVVVKAKQKPPKTKMIGPVKKVIFHQLIGLDRIRQVDCRMIYGQRLERDDVWPRPALKNMDLSAAVKLLIRKLEVICEDNRQIIANLERR